MAVTVRQIDYYYANVRDEIGAAYRVLTALAERGINLLAFTAVPSGPSLAQFAIFPEDPRRLEAEAKLAQIPLEGPHHAFLVQGDDELGSIAHVHQELVDARIDVYASTGVSDGRGAFGYVVYLRPEDIAKAEAALGL